jgi:hypothetical protein
VGEEGNNSPAESERNENPETAKTISGTGSSERQEKSEGLVVREIPDLTEAYDAWKASIPNDYTRDTYTRVIRVFRERFNKPLNQLTLNDAIGFIMLYPTYANRKRAKAALTSFLKFVLKRPPNLEDVNIGERPEPPPIAEPSGEEWRRFWEIAECEPLPKLTALHLLDETGHRRRAIVDLPRDAVQMRPGGPVVVFPPRTQKRGTASVAPITYETYDLVERLRSTHNDPLLFGPIWHKRGKWLYLCVRNVAKRAGFSVRAYPHLFRHKKALDFRRKGVKEDTVINTLGWRDAAIYNSRYGRRQAYETAEEAREYLKNPERPIPERPEPPARPPPIQYEARPERTRYERTPEPARLPGHERTPERRHIEPPEDVATMLGRLARSVEELKEDMRAYRTEEDLGEMIRKKARDLNLEIGYG